MPQQQTFMAWFLPNQPQTMLAGQHRSGSIPEGRAPAGIAVQQDGFGDIVVAARSALMHAPYGQFDQRQRIAPARPQQHSIEMNPAMAHLDQARQQRSIASFAFALAAEKYPAALRNCRAPGSPHPICGTAPKAPLRYLR